MTLTEPLTSPCLNSTSTTKLRSYTAELGGTQPDASLHPLACRTWSWVAPSPMQDPPE